MTLSLAGVTMQAGGGQTSDFFRENRNLLADCSEVRQGRRGFEPKAGHC